MDEMSTQIEQTPDPDVVGDQDGNEKLVMFLEPDQLVADKSRPVRRAELSRRAKVALWTLRVFVLIVSAMVIYTFVAQLAH
jgi:hypothetical protein